ncbi:uncharacterized protein L3040_008424 [Drepanopeziza brunnea f. sp. 'multigermtubi']|uniref:Folylpolyglutamate synthase n=1 Tax=Marssonina brunnea f. sp. multigermtubi (strain MB_m1) TaxID=1072389 RepID=K1WIB9_MARBU|nr:uncharacterized protein MBM_04246 [Drepanopeziza brunnea f. sp. 'multigermtubi' MB_m1]EKD17385.1 hypothetical protein MBM_04246 [Drepanopeziza brunnea f. sp. 'multigermtubi' MB_m1]KAJ5035167.1 hypothetical protein L3040_008424 [Drepanopeziza brunnea f. sp. 'multigermtubi']
MAILFLPTSLRHATIAFSPCGTQSLHRRFSTSPRTISPSRTYNGALKLLDSLQSNRAVTTSISSSSAPGHMDKIAIPEMLEWIRKAGYSVEDLAARGLRGIHIAGTKGKGSVSVMVENILLQYWRSGTVNDTGKAMGRVGLYTSPHLIHVRERIRIDGLPISEVLFKHYFYELWDRFSGAAGVGNVGEMPGYFRYLTIMAFHVFMQEGVESAVIECGIGGEYDSTNILPAEAVTASGITSLGIDHKGMLGETIGEIAWHKGGIMRKGVPAFTVPQDPAAMLILEERAFEKETGLTVVERLPALKNDEVKLGLEGDFQKDNASLAIALASSHLRTLGIAKDTSTDLPEPFIAGLETVSWPARCQYIPDGNTEWFVDGAHTTESLTATAQWFRSRLTLASASPNPPTATMLIFNQADRDATALLKDLMTALQDQALQQTDVEERRRLAPQRCKFTYAAFCTNKVRKTKTEQDLTVQKDLANVFTMLDGNQLCGVYGSVDEAVHLAYKVSKREGERVLVLVTGSLHLAGGVLKVLERKMEARGKLMGKKVEKPTGKNMGERTGEKTGMKTEKKREKTGKKLTGRPTEKLRGNKRGKTERNVRNAK